jgi:hypothetical protein
MRSLTAVARPKAVRAARHLTDALNVAIAEFGEPPTGVSESAMRRCSITLDEFWKTAREDLGLDTVEWDASAT